MDIVVVEEVQDGVNILYCKLKVNDNYYKSMSENGMHIIYIREHHGFVLNISFTTHRAGESVYIIIKNAAENIFVK